MSFKWIKVKQSPNCDSRFGNKIQCIVLHHWGADGQSFSGVCSWFANNASKVSAHYVVEDGKVAQCVSPIKNAWHAGSKYYNRISIGIECRPEHTAGDQKTAAELVCWIWKKYGVLPIKEHRQIASTACPGRWSAKKVYEDAMKLYKAGSSSSSGTASKPSSSGTSANRYQVKIKDLRIRSGAGTNYKMVGFIKPGVYTITEIRKGSGSKAGWGRLKSGAGWISLDYAKKI